MFVYLHFLHIRDHVNVVVMELYLNVNLHFHHISTKVKPCCHGWIFIRLLTFSSYTYSRQRRCHGAILDVYSHFHHISTKVKPCCHGWILVHLLTFSSYTYSHQRRCHGAILDCLLTF